MLQDIVHQAPELPSSRTARSDWKRDGLHGNRGSRVASQRLGGGGAETRRTATLDAGGAAVAPFLVEAQSFGGLLGRALEDVLVFHAIIARRAEGEHGGVEPHHLVPAGLGSVQARPDRDFLGLVRRTI